MLDNKYLQRVNVSAQLCFHISNIKIVSFSQKCVFTQGWWLAFFPKRHATDATVFILLHLYCYVP